MGSIMGQKIDYNGVRALRGQRHNTQQTLTQVTPPPPGHYALLVCRHHNLVFS